MQKVRLWVAIAVVTLGLIGSELSATAKEQRPPQPSDYWWTEFLVGEGGAVLGALVGYVACGRTERGPYPPDVRCENPSQLGLEIRSSILNEPLFWLNLGRAVGASTGVVLVGTTLGVEGNIWGAYLATIVWSFIASNMASSSVGGSYGEIFFSLLPSLPGIPAVIATFVYNYGAKMKSSKTQPATFSWYLSLGEWRF